jgi:hypothetical protein
VRVCVCAAGRDVTCQRRAVRCGAVCFGGCMCGEDRGGRVCMSVCVRVCVLRIPCGVRAGVESRHVCGQGVKSGRPSCWLARPPGQHHNTYHLPTTSHLNSFGSSQAGFNIDKHPPFCASDACTCTCTCTCIPHALLTQPAASPPASGQSPHTPQLLLSALASQHATTPHYTSSHIIRPS